MAISFSFGLRQVGPDLTPPPDLDAITTGMNRRLARDAALRIREHASGGPMARYLTARSGNTARSAFGLPVPGGFVAGARGPGVLANEEGMTIRPRHGRYLTFRLWLPQDTARPTGRWVRARSVTVRAKWFVRDAVDETLTHADEALSDVLTTLGW